MSTCAIHLCSAAVWRLRSYRLLTCAILMRICVVLVLGRIALVQSPFSIAKDRLSFKLLPRQAQGKVCTLLLMTGTGEGVYITNDLA